MNVRKSYKYQSFFRFVLMLFAIILINIIGNEYYKRFDLTIEKRFTLSKATKELLKNVDDIVYVKVYLEGEFPAGFKRLKNSVKEMLDEFRAYSGGNIQYVFIDPSSSKDLQERNAIYQQLIGKGLHPTNLKVQGDDQFSQKIIFPGALFSYQGRELPLQLLENQIGFGPQQVLNNSIELLEYKLANQIKKLIQRKKPVILFTTGQGELPYEQVADISATLEELEYEVGNIDLTKSLIPKATDLLIIAKPTRRFREQEKLKIDQFIMNGGNVLWLIDRVNAEMDSLRGKTVYFAKPYDLNLEDQLFKYGVRINADLVQDIQCNQIPLVVGYMGDAPQTELFPWFYYPVVTSRNQHAIVKNLDAISFKFCNTIDTVRAQGVNKTVLLQSSQYSKALLAPVRLHFSMLQQPPDPNTFKSKHLPIAVLLEGSFESVFKNRLAGSFKAILDSIDQPFLAESKFSKMIVVADGDVIRNEISRDGSAYPLGFYPFTEQTFANKDFILNCIEFLIDDRQLIETRNKEIKLRLLDKTKIKREKNKWQILNVGLPLILITIFGLIYNWGRRRKYTRD